MHLLQLPPETLCQIFDYVGSSYFRSDLSRLRVSKQWSKFAYTACFQDFYVTQKTLRGLLTSPYAETSISVIKDSVEVLDLSLKGLEDWNPSSMSRNSSQTVNVLSVSTGPGRAGYDVLAVWVAELDNDLFRLATISKQARKLRTLRIQAATEIHPQIQLLERRDYLLPTIRVFLSANLTSLELDLIGTRLIPDQHQEHDEGSHICTDIGMLLTTLRRLRLRMHNICAGVLKPRPHSTNLRLNEVLINLSLSNESPLITSATHATCCGSSQGFLQMKAHIEKQAQVLVTQMAAPRLVRILTHELPSIKLRTFDVLTGRIGVLDENAEWDDDGETIEG